MRKVAESITVYAFQRFDDRTPSRLHPLLFVTILIRMSVLTKIRVQLIRYSELLFFLSVGQHDRLLTTLEAI